MNPRYLILLLLINTHLSYVLCFPNDIERYFEPEQYLEDDNDLFHENMNLDDELEDEEEYPMDNSFL